MIRACAGDTGATNVHTHEGTNTASIISSGVPDASTISAPASPTATELQNTRFRLGWYFVALHAVPMRLSAIIVAHSHAGSRLLSLDFKRLGEEFHKAPRIYRIARKTAFFPLVPAARHYKCSIAMIVFMLSAKCIMQAGQITRH